MNSIDGGAALAQRRPANFFWADAAVLGIAIVWGASYPVAKEALLFAPVLVLIFYRFLITSVVMIMIARKDIVSAASGDRIRAIALGCILFLIFIAETYGVSLTSATNTALIISLCVVFTPMLDYGLSGRLPPGGVLIGALASCAGVAVLTGGTAAFGVGDLLVLGAAGLRAVMVVTTKRMMAKRAVSSAALTALQGSTVAVLTLVFMMLQGSGSALWVNADMRFWGAIVFLSLFCTIAAFYVQNAAVRRTTPTRVSLLMGTEPLFGFLLAHILLAEPLSPASLAGAGLVIAGTFTGIVSESRK